jgi:hypothetical protein
MSFIARVHVVYRYIEEEVSDTLGMSDTLGTTDRLLMVGDGILKETPKSYIIHRTLLPLPCDELRLGTKKIMKSQQKFILRLIISHISVSRDSCLCRGND